jgi:hypothetical protein
VLVVFANRHDAGARSLVSRWASQDAALLTCEDLSVPGWRHSLDPSSPGRAVISGCPIATEEIRGVLIRWPGVMSRELGPIAPEDREYVAAEMTAFLRSWLTRLRCPVLNRPTAISLLGPAWRPEQWVHTAAGLGIPVRPIRRHARFSADMPPVQAPPEHATVTVIGERCFGATDPLLACHAQRLAAAAGASLADFHFSGPDADAALISADLNADLDGDERADAVLALLLNGAGSRS